jgi:hypothetical protein
MRTVDKSVNSSAAERPKRRGRWQARQLKGIAMIINLVRRDGDATVVEQIDAPVDFEGSGAQLGVLVTFPLDGRDVTGRIIRVDAAALGASDDEPAIDIELVDRAVLDAESEIALAHLPPKDDFTTDI